MKGRESRPRLLVIDGCAQVIVEVRVNQLGHLLIVALLRIGDQLWVALKFLLPPAIPHPFVITNQLVLLSRDLLLHGGLIFMTTGRSIFGKRDDIQSLVQLRDQMHVRGDLLHEPIYLYLLHGLVDCEQIRPRLPQGEISGLELLNLLLILNLLLLPHVVSGSVCK